MCKVMIGITTYNRKKLLESMARSLYESDLSTAHSIRIYDDGSTEYSRDNLQEIFPDAEKISVNRINKGADLNTWDMYCDFLESDCDYLFNADSDLLFSKDWLLMGLDHIKITDGILSIFNTGIHKSVGEENGLLIKPIFGAAGTLFTRNRIEELVHAFKTGSFEPCHIDWGFCDFFSKAGVKLFCTGKSYVQHIGISGFNSDEKGFCYGMNFIVDSLLNGQTINDILEGFDETKKLSSSPMGYYLFPFDRVNKGERIVIYGAGAVGRDYYRQLIETDYCKVIAIVDKTFDNKTVFPPDRIKEYTFDKIVIATANEAYIDEIRNRVITICPDINNDKIVVARTTKIRI